MPLNLKIFQNLVKTQGQQATGRIVMDGDGGVTASSKSKLGGRNVRIGDGGSENLTVRQKLLYALKGTFKTGIPQSVLKAMNVSSFRSGYAVKNGKIEVSDHPLSMRRLSLIMKAVQQELDNSENAVERGGKVGKDVAAIGAYKLLTGSLDDILAAPCNGVRGQKGVAKNAAVVQDTVALFGQLAKSSGKEGEFFCKIDGKDVCLSWEDGGMVTATVSGNHLERFSLGTDITGLLARLAGEIGSKPDLFGASYGHLLEMLPTAPDADVSVEPSVVRSFAENVIQQVACVPADRLANVTTANLLDIARNAAELYAQNFQQGPNQDTEVGSHFVMLANPRQLVESRIAELTSIIDKIHVTSADAATLLAAMRKDAHVAEKVTIPENFNFQRKSGVKPTATQSLDEVKFGQALRDLAADLVLAEDSTVYDSGMFTGGRELVATLSRHAETVVKLLKAEVNDDLNDEETFKGVGDEAKALLKEFVGELAQKLGFLGLEDEDDLIIEKEEDLVKTIQTALCDPNKASKLFFVKTTMDNKIVNQFDSLQEELNVQIEDTFKADRVMPVTNPLLNTIDKMMDNAMKPGDTGYSSFVKGVLSNYFVKASRGDKKAMAAAVMRYAPPGATEGQKMAAMLKGAGPLLQKILQGLDEHQLGDGGLADAIRDMKENLAPISEDMVKASLRDIVVSSGGKLRKLEAVKTLGCASVGQAILCKAYGPGLPPEGKSVVVKVLRPDALQRIGREKEIIMEIARQNKMEISYGSQINAILEEFDFKHEAENIGAGKVYNTKAHPRIGAVKVEGLSSPATGTLLMECAPGETAESVLKNLDERLGKIPELDQEVTVEENQQIVDQLKDEYAKLSRMQKDLCDMSKLWVSEALYGSGFFHGDLHGGNIMLDPHHGVTMIDFGNVTQLNEFDKSCVTKMMTAAALGARPSPSEYQGEKLIQMQKRYDDAVNVCTRHFLEGLSSLLPPDARTKLMEMDKDVKVRLAKILGAGDQQDAGKRILIALTELQRMGVDIPGPIFKFSQSQMRLQNTIDKMNDKMHEVSSMLRQRILKQMKEFVPLFDSYASVIIDDSKFGVKHAFNLLFSDNKSCSESNCAPLINGMATLVRENGMLDWNNLNAQLAVPGNFLKLSKGSLKVVFDFVKQAENQRLTAAWDNLRDYMSGKIYDHPMIDDAEAERKINAFKKELTAVWKKTWSTLVATTKKESPKDDELETFATGMGKVIKQNLVATKKRVSLDLAIAVQRN